MANIRVVPFNDNDVDDWIDRAKIARPRTDQKLLEDLIRNQRGVHLENVHNENIERIIAKLEQRVEQAQGGRKQRKTKKNKKSKRKTLKRK